MFANRFFFVKGVLQVVYLLVFVIETETDGFGIESIISESRHVPAVKDSRNRVIFFQPTLVRDSKNCSIYIFRTVSMSLRETH